MSDGTGYLVAAYVLALFTVCGYAVALIRGNRAARRRLEAARARHGKSHETEAAEPRDPGRQEVIHV